MEIMIGFNALGKLGRLGNQMFQFSSLVGIAKYHNYDYCIPPSNNKNEWFDHQLFNCFKLSETKKSNVFFLNTNFPVIQESSFSFDEKLFNTCPDFVDLRGYFQTEKYFRHISDYIRSEFKFDDDLLDDCVESFNELENPISLHIRRTDYITNPNHTTLSLDYYKNALTYFSKDRQVLIFSDDPDWCMEQKLFDDDRFIVSQGQSNYMDMCLMTLCSDHIIANSSFSWWGAWLSKSNNVIAPSVWFGPDNKHLNTKDIYCDEWEVL